MAVFNLGPIGRKFDISKGDILIRTQSLSSGGTWSPITNRSTDDYELIIKSNGDWDLKIKTSCKLKFKYSTNIDFFLVGGGGAGHTAFNNGATNNLDTGGYGGHGGWYEMKTDQKCQSQKEIPIIIGHGGGQVNTNTYQQHGNPTIIRLNDTNFHAEGGYGPYDQNAITNPQNSGTGEEQEPNSGHGFYSSWYHWDPCTTIDDEVIQNISRVGFNRLANDNRVGVGGCSSRNSAGVDGTDGYYGFFESSYDWYGGGGGSGSAYTEGYAWTFHDCGLGGRGGGGNGGWYYSTTTAYQPTSGQSNTGGGGGGSGISLNYVSQTFGAGGSGIVLIRNHR